MHSFQIAPKLTASFFFVFVSTSLFLPSSSLSLLLFPPLFSVSLLLSVLLVIICGTGEFEVELVVLEPLGAVGVVWVVWEESVASGAVGVVWVVWEESVTSGAVGVVWVVWEESVTLGAEGVVFLFCGDCKSILSHTHTHTSTHTYWYKKECGHICCEVVGECVMRDISNIAGIHQVR